MDRELLRSQEDIAARHEELGRAMMDPKVLGDGREMKRLGREHARLGGLLEAMQAYRRALDALTEAREILEQGRDADLVALAHGELPELEAAEAARREALKRLLAPHDPDDDRSALVEIRSGTGGEEATLFAADLFRLYVKYAERKGYRVEILLSGRTELGGMREAVLLIEGAGAYGALRFEGGVHRVQRVPVTEASGRIHTSAASVAVLPEAEEVEVEIRPDELKIDVFRSSGPGGQSVNTTDSAVRVTHLPTGIVVQCQDERSQLKNKAKAMKVLYAKLLDMRRQEQEAATTAARRSMVSTGDRSAKIRTYNFPQNRLTDHRINFTVYSLDRFMGGEIDELIEALQLADIEERLRARSGG
ncbi:MAG: peptide chain release factor 1 [Candidatus Eisenbacteria bacterium]|uniref:Peptide chain release factor 1 n=1 Tax=Eiseniibacteriota bacterium TaxID=2212470 RepID=A0A937XAB9_UNCEI|nr:peptide chain release factor 1 [Candidatus Eisenbacteria bacterium]